jgi:WD40 repeat protein
MPLREPSSTQQIVPVPTQALVMRSAALVRRGLRDLSRDSNWLVKKVFSGRAPQVAVSSAGQVCALSPLVRQGSESIALYDVELGVPLLALAVPGDPGVSTPGKQAVFAWSPSGERLVAAWGGWFPELHAFDLNAKKFLGAFGDYADFPAHLAWSEAGNYFAASSSGADSAHVRLWSASQSASGDMPFAAAPASELTLAACHAWPEWRPEWCPGSDRASAADGENADETGVADAAALAGFGSTAFSPDEGSLACVVEIEGEWADDSIAILEIPSLRKQSVFHAQGHITDLAWTYDSRQIIFCSAGQASRLAADTMEPEPLPFGAELCACHPHLPICLCFSSWLKNSAKGRLFLVDLNRLKIFDEYAAEGVVDLRWSLDGSKAYAVTSDGLAYVYEPPLL